MLFRSKLGGGIRLALAQFRELAAFAQFASDLDETTRKQLERGQRITELMKQKQYAPLTVAEMAASLYAADRGFLDDIPLEQVGPFEAALHSFVNSERADLMQRINEAGDFNDDIDAGLKAALDDFKSNHAW